MVSKFCLERMPVFVFLGLCVFLSACQTARPLPSRMYYHQQEYLTYDHFKAMYGALGAKGGWTFGWNWGSASVEKAMTGAEERCDSRRTTYQVLSPCTIMYVGDTYVRGMPENEIEAIIAEYSKGVSVNGSAVTTPDATESETNEPGSSPVKAGTDSEELARKLEFIAGLLEDGLITEEEAEQKRALLLEDY